MGHLAQLVDVVRRNNYIVLDTETTGLDRYAEIVQIAALDSAGRPLIDRLVKPIHPIPPMVTRIHGISDFDVIDAPGWGDLWPLVAAISTHRDIIAYNADFDLRMLRQSFEQSVGLKGWGIYQRAIGGVTCAMRAYAEHWKQPNPRYRGYKWQRLGDACTQQGITVEHTHNALSDCLLTYALIQKMVGDGLEKYGD